MRFQKSDQRRKQPRFMRTAAELICPDSGQFEKPLRPTLVRERCRQRGKSNDMWISWSCRDHRLD